MRDTLPKRIRKNECGILNLDLQQNQGTHYICYYKNNSKRIVFYSFGLPPPEELINYIGRPLKYNSTEFQKRDEVICGIYCLYVLKCLSDNLSFEQIWDKLFYRDSTKKIFP